MESQAISGQNHLKDNISWFILTKLSDFVTTGTYEK
jgi:hypothetical protein